jgi:hypothetical protein
LAPFTYATKKLIDATARTLRSMWDNPLRDYGTATDTIAGQQT